MGDCIPFFPETAKALLLQADLVRFSSVSLFLLCCCLALESLNDGMFSRALFRDTGMVLLTKAGYKFLLADTHSQIWILLEEYLKFAEVRMSLPLGCFPIAISFTLPSKHPFPCAAYGPHCVEGARDFASRASSILVSAQFSGFGARLSTTSPAYWHAFCTAGPAASWARVYEEGFVFGCRGCVRNLLTCSSPFCCGHWKFSV